jgi:hypothetical protein
VSELTAQRHKLRLTRFDSADDFRDFFAAVYGPTIAAYRNVADDPDQTAALDKRAHHCAGRRRLTLTRASGDVKECCGPL